MKKIILILLLMIFSCNVCYASTIRINEYGKNGQKIGSYRQTGNTIIKYGKNGQKVGSYRIKSNGQIDYYNRNGQKERSLR